MYFLLYLFYFVFSISFVEASTTLGLGIVEWDAYANTYKGCKVNFDVRNADDSTAWSGHLKFSPKGVKVGVANGRTQFNPSVKLEYIASPAYGGRLDLDENAGGGTFSCKIIPHVFSASHFQDTNMISWSVNSVLSLQEIVDTVHSLRDVNGEYPKYKFFGYDCEDNVANCATFSCRFLEKIGVTVDSAKELNKWCQPGAGFGFGTFVYYTFGFGTVRDNVQANYVVKELNKHKSTILWNWLSTSTVPTFHENVIENAFGKGFSKKIAY